VRRAIEASQQALDADNMPFGASLISPKWGADLGRAEQSNHKRLLRLRGGTEQSAL
jgi:hypothetical protein